MFNFKNVVAMIGNKAVTRVKLSVIDDFTNVKYGIPEFAHAVAEQIRNGSIFSCRVNKEIGNMLSVEFNRRDKSEEDSEINYLSVVIDDYPSAMSNTSIKTLQSYTPSNTELYTDKYEMEIGHFLYDLIYYYSCGTRLLIVATNSSEE